MKLGNKVQFTSRKGLVNGIVIETKYSRRGQKVARNLNRTLRLRGVDHQVAEGHQVAVVADKERGVIWTVGLGDLKPVGKATKKQLDAARQLQTRIKTGNAEIREERKARNNKRINENDLTGLTPGDKIKVKYTYGWQEETFLGFTSSGKVIFKSSFNKTGKRYSWPEFVKRVK